MNGHVLILESDRAISELLQELLQDAGYRATARQLETIELEEFEQLRPDLIIADVPSLPSDNQAARMKSYARFRQQYATPIIVTTTAIHTLPEIVDALGDPQIRLLLKPFDLEDFYAFVWHFLTPPSTLPRQ